MSEVPTFELAISKSENKRGGPGEQTFDRYQGSNLDLDLQVSRSLDPDPAHASFDSRLFQWFPVSASCKTVAIGDGDWDLR